jgi:hypothetical protein
MDRQEQHRHNAAKEKRWVADASRDAHNLTREAAQLSARGLTVEARFDAEEARLANSWVGKRERILRREERLGGNH